MIPSRRWGSSALRLQSLSSARLAARPTSPLAARCRSTYARLGRVQNPSSRALPYKSPYSSRLSAEASWRTATGASSGEILESRFPRKTVLFLAVVGGLAYYFVDVVPQDWVDDVYNGYSEDAQLATPLHFYNNKEELEHYLQFHKPDPGAALKNPDAARFLSEQFDQLACGWKVSPEDASKENIPVTHGCRFKVNSPCEDYHSMGTSPGTGGAPWNYWSIMDGHAGRHTSFYLQWTLIPAVSSALCDIPRFSSSWEVESTIKDAFLRIDKNIMESARTAANWLPAANSAACYSLMFAFSGSCALLAAFDPENDTLRVANTGDSRAVLGRWDASTQSYTTIPLSVDQTGFNETEVARLAAAHPDEPDIIDPKTGRLLGIAVTRAFGDHRWKWDNDFIKTVQAKFWGPAPRPGSKTPPYMTAEPEVTETHVVRADPQAPSQRHKSDFMIMASDGLWDRISSEHAVECVQRWLEARDRGSGSVANDPHLARTPFETPAPFQLDAGVTVDVAAGDEADWMAEPQYFAIEDDNAAICLARNAMGGSRRGLFLTLISQSPPFNRNSVDDTTVMVVFFDKLAQPAHVDGANRDAEKKSWWKLW